MRELELGSSMGCSYNKKGVKCCKTLKQGSSAPKCILPRRA